LRIVKFTNQDKPYTAFVALNDKDFSDVVEAGTGDLTAYSKHIILVVDTHEPSVEDRLAAREAFAQNYGSVAIKRGDRNA
jgi:hypothetical protein